MKARELQKLLEQMNPEFEVKCWYQQENQISNACSIVDAMQISGSKNEQNNGVILTMGG